MTKIPIFSVIIPVRKKTVYLKQNLAILKKMPNLEIIVITDKISRSANPAFKRNLGAKKAKGDILVFFDDDSYPTKTYFIKAAKIFLNQEIQAACGPQLTPLDDSLEQQASGLILASVLGSGGAGVYRNTISSARFLDDYPSVNLLVRKKTFWKVGGFDTSHWPGEDTLFCRQLYLIANTKLFYSPNLVVYHHRRPIGISFLKQHSRYGQHRGYFAKKYPENSAKIGYFMPTIFVLYLISLIFFHPTFYFLPAFLYLILLTAQFLNFIYLKNSAKSSLLAITFIPLTHIVYGVFFVFGLLKSDLKFQPHQTKSNGNYSGG